MASGHLNLHQIQGITSVISESEERKLQKILKDKKYAKSMKDKKGEESENVFIKVQDRAFTDY